MPWGGHQAHGFTKVVAGEEEEDYVNLEDVGGVHTAFWAILGCRQQKGRKAAEGIWDCIILPPLFYLIHTLSLSHTPNCPFCCYLQTLPTNRSSRGLPTSTGAPPDLGTSPTPPQHHHTAAMVTHSRAACTTRQTVAAAAAAANLQQSS